VKKLKELKMDEIYNLSRRELNSIIKELKSIVKNFIKETDNDRKRKRS